MWLHFRQLLNLNITAETSSEIEMRVFCKLRTDVYNNVEISMYAANRNYSAQIRWHSKKRICFNENDNKDNDAE
jgi:hypothetical protein